MPEESRRGPAAMSGRDPAARLCDLIEGPVGGLLLRSWLDRLVLLWIARWYCPLSRAWAAALAAGGEVERFAAAVGPGAGGARLPARVAAALAETERRAEAYRRALAAWQAGFFEGAGGDLAALERRRLAAAGAYMGARSAFARLHLARRFAPLRWAVASPAAVEAAQGARLAAPNPWPAPPAVEVQESPRFAGAFGETGFLRFASPVMDEPVCARVIRPAGVADPPTLVFLHGIAMETEFWDWPGDPINRLAARGVRVVRPEGPWHGQRRPAGWYGGEPALGRAPLGLIELFEAWVAEAAALIRWARETSRGPVAVGGVSLGALTSQLVVQAAGGWPAACRPDAALLVATSGALDELAETGSLTRALGLPARLRAAGWDAATRARWLPLLAPLGAPGVAPGRIVMLLGAADDLTPVAGGRALAARWRLPAANLFVAPGRGHFSVSIGLQRDPAPLERLRALLGAG